MADISPASPNAALMGLYAFVKEYFRRRRIKEEIHELQMDIYYVTRQYDQDDARKAKYIFVKLKKIRELRKQLDQK